MNVFLIFDDLLHLLSGLAMLFTGLFLWRSFREDLENRTFGGILGLLSLIFFLMFFRILFWSLGWIGEDLCRYVFFVEHAILFSALLLFALPRILDSIFNRPIVAKVSLALGTILYLVYLVVHVTQKEKVIAHYALQGLLFEAPFLEKIFLLGIFGLFLPLIVCRAGTHFLYWRRKKAPPYKFLNYLLFLFIFAMAVVGVSPQYHPWTSGRAFILILAGVLAIYIVSSQEASEREK